MVDDKVLREVAYFLETLPDFYSAKVYGSYVTSTEPIKKGEIRQIDLIIAVDNLREFFLENISKNPEMYHFVPKVFFSHASEKELKVLGNSCYTSHIKFMDHHFKMGVIEKEDLVEDLRNWKTFFMAGRFQKEMQTLKEDTDIELANLKNKRNAIITSFLLMNKDNPSLMELYRTLCSLSYIGDERKRWHAEDPLKVSKIASNSRDFFDKEYTSKCNLFSITGMREVLYEYEEILKEISSLPQDLRYRLYDVMKMYFGESDSVLRDQLSQSVYGFLYSKNARASRDQILKGVITTGPLNSVDYTLAKLKKGRMKGN